MKVLLTGAAGFLAQDITRVLLDEGHEVLGIDNYSKYPKSSCLAPIEIIEGDARDENLLTHYLKGQDCFIPLAAMVGGIDYFHQNPFTIMSYNDELTQAAFKAAIKMKPSRTLLISSSMVFENTSEDFMLEEKLSSSPAPSSSYGFQKLNLEKYAEFAWQQYGLPFEVIRPFNGVGIGELQNLDEAWEKIKKGIPTELHAIPELIMKCMYFDSSIKIYGDGEQIRCFTSSRDIALGVGKILNRKYDKLRYYHLSSSHPVKIIDLVSLILEVVRPHEKISIEKLNSYSWDVKKRIPQTFQTKEVLSFQTTIELKEMIQEIHSYILQQGVCK